jgi:hypothetical protein
MGSPHGQRRRFGNRYPLLLALGFLLLLVMPALDTVAEGGIELAPTKYPNTGAGPGGAVPQAMAFSQTNPIRVSEGDIVVFDEDGRIVRVVDDPTPLDRLELVFRAVPAWIYVLTVIVVVGVVIHDRKVRDELPEIEARMRAPTIDRPVWLAEAKDESPAARPAWFTGEPATPPSDRPAWMTGSPDASTNR